MLYTLKDKCQAMVKHNLSALSSYVPEKGWGGRAQNKIWLQVFFKFGEKQFK